LRNSIRWVKEQRPKNPARNRCIRILVDRLAQDPSLLSHGEFVTGLINSNSDSRKHVTLRVITMDMIARNRSRIVHIYSKNDEEMEYDGFSIFPERDDKKEDGTPGETV
ncbi:hypothetical protein K505DRAFT_191861, partial [Melanomma pulvis-pyrius CBS 109.77]